MQVYNDELMHYGVLGMRWGHRKGVSLSSKEKKEMRQDRDDTTIKIEKKLDKKYQKHTKPRDEIEALELDEKISKELGESVSNYMVKKYGQEKVDALKRSDKLRSDLSLAALATIAAVSVAAVKTVSNKN